jgi:hypothetical protein
MQINSRFNIEDYDIIVSCYGDSDSNRFGLVRIKKGKLEVIDELNSTGIGIYGNRIYRLMSHKPYGVSRVLEMAVYEDVLNEVTPLSLIYHGIAHPHDIFVHYGLIYIVSSGTNEILCLSENDFKPVKKIKFEGTGNAWHINCLGVIDGRICISAFNICSDDFGWQKTKTKEQGFIMDIETKEKIWEGLSMPHNPYQFGNKIVVCNSETHSVLFLGGGSIK